MADLNTLFKYLRAADKAGNKDDATEIARMIRAVQANEMNRQRGDSSLGTAMEHSFERMQQGSTGYIANLASAVDKSGVGQAYYGAQNLFNDKIYNPIARFFGGEERNVAGEGEKTTGELKSEELINKAQKRSDEAGERADALNYESMTTDDVNSVGSALRFAITKGAESLPYMTASPALLAGTIMPGEVNQALKEIEGLDENKRLALAASGGAIMGVLERFGASQVFQGLPKTIIGKMGVQGTVEHLRKKGLYGVANAILRAGAVEGATEFAQENVKMGAETLGGKDINSEEYWNRSKEAFWGGVGGGATIGGGVDVTTRTARKASDIVSSMNVPPEDMAINKRLAIRMDNLKTIENLDPTDVGTYESGAMTLFQNTQDEIQTDLEQILNENTDDVDHNTAAKKINDIIKNDRKLQNSIKQAKNKSKTYIRKEQFDAWNDALGDTEEGREIINLLEESNNLAKFWNMNNGDLKGGLSQYTDQVNPLTKGTGLNNLGRGAMTGLLGIGAIATGNPLLAVGTAVGTVGAGRVIDKVTGGRRSRIDRFMRVNRGDGRSTQGPVSLRSLKKDAKIDNETAKIKREVAELVARRTKERDAEKARIDKEAKEQAKIDAGIRKFQFQMLAGQMKSVLEKAQEGQSPRGSRTIVPKNDAEQVQLQTAIKEESENNKLAIEQRNSGAPPKLRTGEGKQDAASPEGSVFEALGHTVLNKTTGRHELIDKSPDASIRIRAEIQRYLDAAKLNPSNQSEEAQRALAIYETNVARERAIYDVDKDGNKVAILSPIISMLQKEKINADFNEINTQEAALTQTPSVADLEAQASTSPAALTQGPTVAELEADNSASPAALTVPEDPVVAVEPKLVLNIEAEGRPEQDGIKNINQAQKINETIHQSIINNTIAPETSDTTSVRNMRKRIENKVAQGQQASLSPMQSMFSLLPKSAKSNKNHPVRKELSKFKTNLRNSPEYKNLPMPETGEVTPLWLYIINPKLLGVLAPKSKALIKNRLPKLV